MRFFKEKHTLLSTYDYFGEEKFVFDISVKVVKYFIGIPYYISSDMKDEIYSEYLNRKYDSNLTFHDKREIMDVYIRDFKLKGLLDNNSNSYFTTDRHITTMIKETPIKIN